MIESISRMISVPISQIGIIETRRGRDRMDRGDWWTAERISAPARDMRDSRGQQ